jgi:hypothetical protein
MATDGVKCHSHIVVGRQTLEYQLQEQRVAAFEAISFDYAEYGCAQDCKC